MFNSQNDHIDKHDILFQFIPPLRCMFDDKADCRCSNHMVTETKISQDSCAADMKLAQGIAAYQLLSSLEA